MPSTLAALPDGTLSMTPQEPLASGPHQLAFSITDAAGNTSTPSAPASVTILATPPTVTGSPTTASPTTTSRTLSITVPAVDVGKGTLHLHVDGQVTASTAASSPEGSVILTPTAALSTGSHQLAYSITDAAGTSSGVSPAVTILVQLPNTLTGVGSHDTALASGAQTEVTGAASSGHVTFSLAATSAGVCTLAETTVTGRTPGTCEVIVASPAGTGRDGQPYAAATSQTITIPVTAAPQTLRFLDRVTQGFRSQSLPVTALSDRGVEGFAYSSTPGSVCAIDPSTGLLTGRSAGTCTVTATIPTTVMGGVTYAQATTSKSVSVSRYGISVVAGVGTSGYSGDGGPATGAQFWAPSSVAVDTAGNVYIADRFNSVTRKVTASGTVTTLAGTGTRGYSGDGRPALSAQLNVPNAVAVDGSGNVFIADTGNHVVRRVSASGVITTIAGSGTNGYAGDGGPATGAWLASPFSLAVGTGGTLYIGDYDNGVIRRVDSGGTITTLAGTGTAGYSGDGGPAISARLSSPYGLGVDAGGNVIFSDYANSRLRRISTAGIITTIAGTGMVGYSGDGGAATSAQIGYPTGVSVDAGGNVLFADGFDSRVRRIDSQGVISTVVDAGPAARLDQPTGIAVSGGGTIYVTETGSNQLRQLTP